MHVEKLTFNKDNWSGEDATVEFAYEDGSIFWEQYGYRFQLTPPADLGDGLIIRELLGDGWTRPLCTLYYHPDRNGMTGYWEAVGTVTRDHPHPEIAAACYLFNCI